MSYKLKSFVVFFTFLKIGSKLSNSTDLGKISAQPHTIVFVIVISIQELNA